MNATLAGGVAIGTCCDIISLPGVAMCVGLTAGIISALGFEKISPYLATKINLQDTCGVGSLHGMPGLLGGFTSIIAIPYFVEDFDYTKKSSWEHKGYSYFPAMKDSGKVSDQVKA